VSNWWDNLPEKLKDFLGKAPVPPLRSARGDARDHIVLPKKRPRTFVSALAGIAAAESSKCEIFRGV
jgi:hypothetical protein